MLSQLLTKSIRSYLLHEGLFNTQGIDRQMADGLMTERLLRLCRQKKKPTRKEIYFSEPLVSSSFCEHFFSTVYTVLTEVKRSSSVVVHVFCIFISRVISEDLY